MTEGFDAVVVGAGALGASTAYHLLREGRSVALLDRGRVVAETSPRAAGLSMQLRDDLISPIARLSVAKLLAFEEETGVPLTVHRSGSIKVARADADEAQIHAEVRRAAASGLELDHIGPERARRLAPWFDPANATAMWFAPGDTYMEPGDVPHAYVAAFRAGGGCVREHAEVTAIGSEGGDVTHVGCRDGAKLETGAVVVAAGAWSPVVAALADAAVPLWPVRHQLFTTTRLPGVDNTQPAVRIMDARTYTRPYDGGLMFGGYEADPVTMDLRRESPTFGIATMPLDGEPLGKMLAMVRDEFPSLAGAERRELRGGLTTLVPDGRFLVGPLDPLAGLWLISGCNVGGLSTSPALGQHLARWIATGERPEELAPFDPNRFGDTYLDPAALREAAVRTYTHKYSSEEVYQDRQA
ncbi:MAG: FAD-binding oxidoreductase [Actinobacteria bacterium]|nr:FAD-binding oxidoreductase [Actinomycetota bacterium]